MLDNENNLNYIGHLKEYKPNENTRFLLLHRPVYSLSLVFLIRRLKKKGVKIIADVDDLIIHPDFSSYSPAVLNKVLKESSVSKKYAKNFKALNLCDFLICSTDRLELILNDYFPSIPTTVLYNCIFHKWKVGVNKMEKRTEKPVTYFPGTQSHDRDFNIIRKPLESFLRDTPKAKLEIVGPLSLSLKVSEAQLRHRPKVPFIQYDELVRSSGINLAPLEDTLFNNCKSGLKAIEAGAFGIPTISSPNEDASRFENQAVYIAKTEDDWYNFLIENYNNEKFDQLLCHDNVRRQADIKSMARKFYLEVLTHV